MPTLTEIGRKIRVVLYARVSTLKQALKDLSIPEQLRQMQLLCRRNGYEVVKIYIEEGASARDDRRPVFQQMIYELLSGTVEADSVIVYARSRFFRDAYRAKFYERKLEKKGIKVISVTLPTESLDAPAEHLMKNMDDAVSQYQSEMTGLLTLGAMVSNANKGYFNGGRAPYGFRVRSMKDERGNQKSKLEVSPKEAEVVRLIFRLKLERGLGAGRIASSLNQRGLRKRNGRPWTKDNILSVLKNPAYKGERIFNRYASRTKTEKPESEWVTIKVDQIVGHDSFRQVQELLEQSRPSATNPAVVSSPTLLSGILKCGRCGKSMTLETAKGGLYRYYNCRGCIREGTCPGQRIPVETTDSDVLDHVTSKLFSVKRLHLILKDWISEKKKEKRSHKEQETPVQSDINEEKRKLENIYRAIEEGIVTKSNINERINQIRRNIQLLEERLTTIRKLRTDSIPSRLLTVPFLQNFQRRLNELFYQDSALAKQYLKLFLDKIQVKGQTVRIVARKDILLRAISLAREDNFGRVPTAGGVWLPGQDSNQMRDITPL